MGAQQQQRRRDVRTCNAVACTGEKRKATSQHVRSSEAKAGRSGSAPEPERGASDVAIVLWLHASDIQERIGPHQLSSRRPHAWGGESS